MASLMARMEYMAVSLGVDVIMLDHITAAAAGLMNTSGKDVEGGGSERLIIDAMMRDMRSLSVRTGVHIDIVSQLKKTDKAFEEGSRITMQDLRGSVLSPRFPIRLSLSSVTDRTRTSVLLTPLLFVF